jgi:hypothetical protein
MKLLSVFNVSLREQLRSPWDLLLVLVLAPGLIWMYWSFMSGGSTSYPVLVIDDDAGMCAAGDRSRSCAEQAIAQVAQVAYENGNPLLRVSTLTSRA